MNDIFVSDYDYLKHEELLKVSNLRNKVLELINSTDIHEDLIELMLKPFEDILKHNGVNLIDRDF